MELRVESHHSTDVICLSGRLDLVSSSALKDMIRQRLADKRLQLIVDMEKVHFINSSGLGALISSLRDVRVTGGRLVVCRLAPYIDEIFRITGLDRVFDCYPTVAEALGSFNRVRQQTTVQSQDVTP